MGTELLYQKDSYLRVFDAVIVEVTNEGVVLDRTAFHPTTGGVANDTGWLYIGLSKCEVVDVKTDKGSGKVVHVLNTLEGVKPGLNVRGELNWDRRYKLMRLHTAAHILSAILYSDYGALVTGGSVEPDKAKEDYDIKEAKPEEAFAKAISKANEVVEKGIEVKIYWLSREEALKIPGIVKLASRMPPAIETLRIVEIPGIDIQADGGPHVKNTSEIGEITLLKVENKGKNRKRIYYTVKP